MTKLISELLDLPDRVRKGDFVLNLAKGVTEPDKTLRQYSGHAATGHLLRRCLGFVGSAVEAADSKACYLHGSFGSGKSHFMAARKQTLDSQTKVYSRHSLVGTLIRADRQRRESAYLGFPGHNNGSQQSPEADDSLVKCIVCCITKCCEWQPMATDLTG